MVYLTAQDRDALSVNTNHLISKTGWELKKKNRKANNCRARGALEEGRY